MVSIESRDRGVLNKSEVEYLLGESEVEPQTQHERSVRSRIRKHIVQAIIDFDLIADAVEERDRKQIFDQYRERPIEGDPNDFQQGVNELLKFIYIGLRENDVDVEWVFETAIKAGEAQYIKKETDDYPRTTRADVSVDVAEQRDEAEVRSRLEEGDPLRFEDLQALDDQDEDTELVELETVILDTDLSPHATIEQADELADRAKGILLEKGYRTHDVQIKAD